MANHMVCRQRYSFGVHPYFSSNFLKKNPVFSYPTAMLMSQVGSVVVRSSMAACDNRWFWMSCLYV